jgi:amino acid transporter
MEDEDTFVNRLVACFVVVALVIGAVLLGVFTWLGFPILALVLGLLPIVWLLATLLMGVLTEVVGPKNLRRWLRR